MIPFLLWSLSACGSGKEDTADYQPEAAFDVVLNGGTVLEFVLVQGGVFTMGSSEPNSDETAHEVTLEHDFYVMTTEATQSNYEDAMGYNSSENGSFHSIGPNFPVYSTSWHEAAAFANAISHQDGQTSCYQCTGSEKDVICTQASDNIYDCSGYRLGTEAEWEFASRAGSSADIWTPNNGGDIPQGYEGSEGCNIGWNLSDGSSLFDLAWFCGNRMDEAGANGAKEVKQRLANANGLFDMIGNSAEWTNDWYDADYYENSSATNPVGPSETNSRVVRGGDWSSVPHVLRSSSRNHYVLTSHDNKVGFRLFRSIP